MTLAMRFLKSKFSTHTDPKNDGRFRQLALIAGSCVTSEPEITLAQSGFSLGYVGGVAPYQPRASAVAGR